jgi:tol-pal system protein YbgF
VVLGSSGCAQAAPASAAPSTVSVDQVAAQMSALQQKLDERDELVTQLEGRLSLLEAEQRQLRFALAEREAAPVGLRETVRIGAREEREREPKREPRPVLRLYEDHRPSEAALAPVPEVSERLPIAPLPESLGLAKGRPPSESVGSAREQNKDPYRSAIDLVRRRDFGAALSALSQFIATHPDDERVGKAQFWRGEVLFAQKNYGPALSAFESSLSEEPQGEKAADSWLKIVLCHKRLGAPERARAAIKQLKAQFPQSNAARLAQAEEA